MPESSSTKHQKVHAFLKNHPMGILSTVGEDGSPWGSAIYYVADEEFNFYFVTRVETLKYKNLDRLPLAALTVADGDSQTTVQVSGNISKVPVQQYMDVFFDKFAKIRPKGDHEWSPPLEKIHKGSFMPLRLTPTTLQFSDYKDTKPGLHPNYVEKIIPA